MAEAKNVGDLTSGRVVGRSSAPLFRPDERVMADEPEGNYRPDSGPLTGTQGKYTRDDRGEVDEVAGGNTRELGTDPFIDGAGSNQFLGHQATHHGETAKVTSKVWTEYSNTAQRLGGTRFPIQTFVDNGPPNAINPAGTITPESETE